MKNYFLKLPNKAKKYINKYPNKPRLVALIMCLWNLKCLVTPELIRKPKFKTPKNKIHVLFKLYGGLGDIIISLNYLLHLKEKTKNILIDISVTEKFFNEISFIVSQQSFINSIYIDTKTSENYDLIADFSRIPIIKIINQEKISNLDKQFSQWTNIILNFNKQYPEYLIGGSVSDRLLEQFSIYQNRTRLAEADIEDFLKVKTKLKIKSPQNEKEILEKFNLSNEKYITLQCGVGTQDKGFGRISTKMWPIENYHKLSKLLKKRYPNYKLIQIGLGNCNTINNTDKNLCGLTNFKEIITILKNSSLHIDTECGSVHLRHFICAKPSLVLFGPTNINFYGYFENLNISSNLCPPCEWLHSRTTTFCMISKSPYATCMKNILPETVINKIIENDLLTNNS